MGTIVQTYVRKRGFFGKVFKFLLIAFNIIMLIWLISYFGEIGRLSSAATSDAGRAGTAIGGTLGIGLIIFTWVSGTIVLGLFTLLTRGKTVIITEDRS
jgi:Fe2+ transport system protein B